MKNTVLYSLLFAISFLAVSCSTKDKEPEYIAPTIELSSQSVRVEQGKTVQLAATVRGTDTEGSTIIWTSSNESVRVDQSGLVTGVAQNEDLSVIETYVTAKLSTSETSARCKVVVYAQGNGGEEPSKQGFLFKYRITLKDKGESRFSTANPSEFLSQKAIDRRVKYGIKVDESDLPISTDYIKEITNIGGTVVVQSKWLKTVVMHCNDERLANRWAKLYFVASVEKVWEQADPNAKGAGKNAIISQPSAATKAYTQAGYGDAWENIKLNKGNYLHDKGFRGQGVNIAVIDGGFSGMDDMTVFRDMKILGKKSFVYEQQSIYEGSNHGTAVLSCIASNKVGTFIGSAPEANYWLLKSEDTTPGDTPVEEDYMVAAMEYADSVGVDVISSSIGYLNFRAPFESYTAQKMDGKTAFATRGANAAASKGIVIVCSAGNHRSWVGSPADSPSILTVGSVDKNGALGAFTAWGQTADGRTKPDVMSLGEHTAYMVSEGFVIYGGGTSLSTPIMSGMAACLLQAYPNLKPAQIIDIVRKASDRANNPDEKFGYGIPDMQKADQLASQKKKK